MRPITIEAMPASVACVVAFVILACAGAGCVGGFPDRPSEVDTPATSSARTDATDGIGASPAQPDADAAGLTPPTDALVPDESREMVADVTVDVAAEVVGDAGVDMSASPAPSVAPSCRDLPVNCGPKADDSCCAAPGLPGGEYNRGNDPLYPATVSAFALDKYEVTVGRFRRFFLAGGGTQTSPPAEGAGAHPLIAGSGWKASWNAELPASSESLRKLVGIPSNITTWTESVGPNENRPVTHLTWYLAFAFCAWDDGRLPTDAEWNFAAAGGSEQRVYPWSTPPPSTVIDPRYASYGCGATCIPASFALVGSKALGAGRWGHADLAGNVSEWVLDLGGPTKASYPVPCVDCASLTGNSLARVWRGGSAGDPAQYVVSSTRDGDGPAGTNYYLGVRCARRAR